MDIARKVEMAKQLVASIASHFDAGEKEVRAVLQELKTHLSESISGLSDSFGAHEAATAEEASRVEGLKAQARGASAPANESTDEDETPKRGKARKE